MKEKDNFFSQKHKQLLNIATWVRYLAWAALFYYIIRTGLVFIQYQVDLQRAQLIAGGASAVQSFSEMLKIDPIYFWIDMASNMFTLFLRGIVYYVTLTGISLGLNMIVETDINYRENRNEGGAE